MKIPAICDFATPVKIPAIFAKFEKFCNFVEIPSIVAKFSQLCENSQHYEIFAGVAKIFTGLRNPPALHIFPVFVDFLYFLFSSHFAILD